MSTPYGPLDVGSIWNINCLFKPSVTIFLLEKVETGTVFVPKVSHTVSGTMYTGNE